jgi:hypothetical protein
MRDNEQVTPASAAAMEESGQNKAAFQQEGRKQSGVIVTSELPPNLVEVLKCFDQDGDGNLDLDEIAEAARVYQATKDKAKMYKKVAIALFGLLCAYTAALGGMIFAIVDANKDTQMDGGKMVDRATGKVSTIGSASEKVSLQQLYDKISISKSGDPFLLEVPTLVYSDTEVSGMTVEGYVSGFKFHEASKRVLVTFTNGDGAILKENHKAKSIKLARHAADWWQLSLHRARELGHTSCWRCSDYDGPYGSIKIR